MTVDRTDRIDSCLVNSIRTQKYKRRFRAVKRANNFVIV
jgi:hypothetical protein